MPEPAQSAESVRECIGLLGRIFGHRFVDAVVNDQPKGWACIRCGFVVGERQIDGTMRTPKCPECGRPVPIKGSWTCQCGAHFDGLEGD